MTAMLGNAETDLLQPFTLEGAAVRGRLVRLGVVVDTILSRHAYPDAVSTMLGELLVVASMLSSNLKQEGIFTIQMRGNGIVPMLVVDSVYGGELRGYAQLTDAAQEALQALGAHPTSRQLFGDDSYLAITFDPGKGLQRYQGVVALEGDTISDALVAYFTQSQQLDVWFTLSCARIKESGAWSAGGLMIERVADYGGIKADAAVLQLPPEEAWRTALALSNTVKAYELLDSHLALGELLFRLFHENDARITPPQPLSVGCRCSRGRIFDMLMSMSVEDRADMLVDGAVSVTCQFCNQVERFTADELGLPALQ